MKTMKKFDCKATWEDIDELVRGAEIGTVIKMSCDSYDFEDLEAEPRHIEVKYEKVLREDAEDDEDYEWEEYCESYRCGASGEDDMDVIRALVFDGIDLAQFSEGDGFYETENPMKNFEITVTC